jgi:hypothetical protein
LQIALRQLVEIVIAGSAAGDRDRVIRVGVRALHRVDDLACGVIVGNIDRD